MQEGFQIRDHIKREKDPLPTPSSRILRIQKIACKACLQQSREAIAASSPSSNGVAKPQSQTCLEIARTAKPSIPTTISMTPSSPPHPCPSLNPPTIKTIAAAVITVSPHSNGVKVGRMFSCRSIFFWTDRIEGSSGSGWKGSGEDLPILNSIFALPLKTVASKTYMVQYYYAKMYIKVVLVHGFWFHRARLRTSASHQMETFTTK